MKLQPPGLPAEVCERIFAELVRSELVVGYIRDFGEISGGTIELRAVATWTACKIVGERGDSLRGLVQKAFGVCAPFVDTEKAMVEPPPPITVACLREALQTGVPVQIGESVIGFLVMKCGGRVLARSSRRRAVAMRLLMVFAQHLSLLAAELILRIAEGESSAVGRARVFIDEHYTESLSLASTAKAARLSAVHFCRVFKKATGFGFSTYLAHLRIERAKSLLRDRGLRVSEIANAVGYVSVPHFNRVFKRLEGKSPTAFRGALRGER